MKTFSIIFSYLLIFSVIVKGQNTCDRYFSTKLTYHNNSLNLHYDNVTTGNDYRIFYRTNEPVNTNLNVIDIKKPIIIIEGYDIMDEESCQEIYDHYINNYDNNFLGAYLRANGYDIITYNLSVPSAALQPNALVFANFIDFINQNKTGNEELIIMGISMGGLLARYALTYMEQQGRQHQTKLFLSFDSPQQGAYAPLSMQALLTDNTVVLLAIFSSNVQLQHIISSLLSDGSQQMLTHNIYNVSNGHALPSQKYTDFFNELTSMNECGGYPINCKRVGISNGSLKADRQRDRIFPVGYPEGDIGIRSGTSAVFFSIPYLLGRWLYTAPGVDNYDLTNSGANGTCVYQSTSICDMGTDKYFLKNDVQPVEHIPGGYYPWYQMLVDNLPSYIVIQHYLMDRSCFVSTISALDLNTNYGFLKLSDYSKSQVLANSRFDDIWWDVSHDNMPHTSYNSSLRNFIENQIFLSQTESYAQPDCTISGGTTNSDEKKLYKASNSVTIGNHTVNSGAQLMLKSGNSIILNPGFEVKAGATFSASIEDIHSRDCNLAGNLPQFSPSAPSNINSNIVQIDATINGDTVPYYVPAGYSDYTITDDKSASMQDVAEINKQLFIFPNPSEYKSTILYTNPKQQSIVIQLIDPLSSRTLKTIYKGIKEEGIVNIPLDVSNLASGMYIITIHTENAIVNGKLIKK